MSSAQKNRRHETVRIIDHEPLASSREQKAKHSGYGNASSAPVFGKRTAQATSPKDAESSPERPFEKNGISAYFIDRVKARQNEPASRLKEKPSAIRKPGAGLGSANSAFTSSSSNGEGQIPYSALAAVFALAVAIPVGFIWLTERSGGPAIDYTTTASITAEEGLRVDKVNMTRILKNGSFVVTVSGKISNTADKRKALMPLTISLIDKDGVEVQSWRHRTGTGIVKPDGSLFFNTSAIDFSGRADTAHVVARTVK